MLVYIMENHIEMDDLGVPLFQETTICPSYESAMILVIFIDRPRLSNLFDILLIRQHG